MDIRGHRRSSNFEDLGHGGGKRRRGGGIPVNALLSVVRVLGFKGTAVVGVVAVAGYALLPASVTQPLLAAISGNAGGVAPAGPKLCKASSRNEKACDFSRAVLASTEDVWKELFRRGELPSKGGSRPYLEPTLRMFSGGVATDGCGNASSAVGPFYCPADRKLYIDPGFYDVMETKLKAPGDFAQAYVIAHEVGHHIQNLIGSSRQSVRGETKNQTSVRVELQADCLAGVWGHSARSTLKITDEDLREAVNAAHAIGDDTLGQSDESQFSHGSSEQRMRWFRSGFQGGDARRCDTFAVKSYAAL